MKLFKNLVILLIFCTFVSASTVNLLAVVENGNNSMGSIAKMKVDVRAGQGDVFLNTYPFARIDTQVSARIANKVACTYANGCNNNDFFYSIQLNSPSIGGPSAGAAISLLTAANLNGDTIDPDFAVTGTINSGGMIGPVGGVEPKVKAAIKAGMKKIAVPFSQDSFKKLNNSMGKIQFNQIKIMFNSTTDELIAKGVYENTEFDWVGKENISTNFSDALVLYYNDNEVIFADDFHTQINDTDDFLNFFENNIQLFFSDELFDYSSVDVHFYANENFEILEELNLTSFSDLLNSYYYEYSLQDFAKDNGVELKEFVDFEDLYEFATGSRLSNREFNLSVPDKYTNILNNLSQQLCGEFNNSMSSINSLNFDRIAEYDSDFEIILTDLNDSRQIISNLVNDKKYYTAASICFAKNINADYLESLSSFNGSDFGYQSQEMKTDLANYSNFIDNIKIDTLIDLQTIGIIKNRIREVEFYLDNLDESNPSSYFRSLSYAKNRLSTAKGWLIFYGKSDKKINLDQSILQNSCNSRLLEVQERFSFLQQISELGIDSFAEQLEDINAYYANQEYIDCVYESSVLKARLDNILLSGGFTIDKLDSFYEQKVKIIEKNVARQIEDGEFPILGYSYLEYADHLKNHSVMEALQFLSLALELNNLDIYLPEQENKITGSFINDVTNSDLIFLYILDGILICLIIYYLFFRNRKPAKKQIKVRPSSKADMNNLIKVAHDNKNIANKTNIMVVKPENANVLFEGIKFKVEDEKSNLFDDDFKSKIFNKLK